MPGRRGAVDIVSGTRRPGFESCQVIIFLGKHSSAVMYKMMGCVLKLEIKAVATNLYIF
jgi:hypothetical protein